MRGNMIQLNLREAVEELSAMKPVLRSSIGRFARDLEAENRSNERQPRTGQRSTRLPGPPEGRVVAHRAAHERIERVARRHEATPLQVALAWLLDHSRAMLVIPGTSSVSHLEEDVAAAELELDDEDIRILNSIHHR